MALKGFWSYAHADDEAEGGRIIRLARDVADQFALITGEAVELFLDKERLEWGDEWRAQIDASLASVAFFVPVLTPRYFMSVECRRELQYFARRASDLGVRELVLPLLYVNVPALEDDATEDDLIKPITVFQRQDWRDLRFEDLSAGKYRRAIAGLAERLVEANRHAEAVEKVKTLTEVNGAADEHDEPAGILDRLATAEESLPKWNDTVTAIGREIEQVGTIVAEGAAELRRPEVQRKGFGGRMYVARKVAGLLESPAERLSALANEFSTQLHDVDEGFRTLIMRVAIEAEDDPMAAKAACEFFEMLESMVETAQHAMDTVQALIKEIAPLEALSRDLRPPLRRLREGLTLMLEVREVGDEWLRLISNTGIDCRSVSSERPDLESGQK